MACEQGNNECDGFHGSVLDAECGVWFPRAFRVLTPAALSGRHGLAHAIGSSLECEGAKKKKGMGVGRLTSRIAGAQRPIAASSAYPSGLPGSSEDAWRGPLVPPDPISAMRLPERPRGSRPNIRIGRSVCARPVISGRKGRVVRVRGRLRSIHQTKNPAHDERGVVLS